MRALPDHRKGRVRALFDRLGAMAPASGASILRSRLFIKYVVLFVAVVGLALVANGVFDVYFSYQEQKTSLVRIQREQAEAAAGKIGQFISEIESQVGWTTQLPWSSGTLEQRRFDALRLLRQVPAITELAEIDATGHEQLRVSRLAMEVVGSGVDVSKDPSFAEAVAHKVYFGPVYFRRESEPYMTLSLAGTRRDTGVSIAQVNLKLIWDVLSKIKFTGHGRAYVVDAAGRLIAHPDISLVLRNTDMSKLAQVQAARAAVAGEDREQVREAEDIEGNKVLTASAPVAPLGWLVFVETPIQEAYAPLYASLERTALVLLSALALAFAAGMFLARRMVVPIQTLRAGAARLGSGDLGQRIAIKTGDEIEGLADQFNDMAGRLQESYANLEQKVELRTRELSESLEQQTATSEVLKVISSSPGDVQPVFAAILANALHLCEANFGILHRFEGGAFQIQASRGVPRAYADLVQQNPIKPDPRTTFGQILATKELAHVADLTQTQAYLEREPTRVQIVEIAGARTLLVVPMLKDAEVVGDISIYRTEVRPFSEKQVELVKNFMAQAVIAIENARLLSELRESLQQQTATADVLKVISRSTFDLKKVLSTLVESAARLCAADKAALFQRDGEVYRMATTYGFEGDAERLGDRPLRPDRTSVTGRVALEGKAVHVHDVLADPEYHSPDYQQAFGYRTNLGVPLLRDGTTIGVFALVRNEVNPFTEKQIELVTTFADQAVIAIENARLFEAEQERTRELTESLEQQTATSEVLKVISSSPGELEPVFETLLQNAVRICGANFGNLWLRDGDFFHIGATHGAPAEWSEFLRRKSTFRANRSVGLGQILVTKQTYQVADVVALPTLGDELREATINLSKARSLIGVPLLRDEEVVGCIVIYRQEVKPFTDKQIEVVQNFAAQAVIAIENARLLNELRESLAQQTATSEVLGVISRSKFELQPILQSVVDTAARLCRADGAVIFRLADGLYRFAAGYSLVPEYLEIERRTPISPGPGTLIGRAALSRQVALIEDAWADAGYEEKDAAKIAQARSMMGVPLLRDGEAIGVIGVARHRVEPFGERESELVTTFADQAVIAIENVRLFEAEQERTRELSESLAQQTATADVLGVISSSPGDLAPVFAAMLDNAVRICGATFGNIYRWDGESLHLVAAKNTPTALAEYRKHSPYRHDAKTPIGRMMTTKSLIHIDDLAADEAYLKRIPETVAAVEAGGIRTLLAVPMVKEGNLIGAFTLCRREVLPFTDKQIALVTSFANQAVIAIENARLLSELRESLDQQTATADVLGVISSSPGDLAPVFQAMLEKAVRICDAKFGNVYRWDTDGGHLVASCNTPPALVEARRRSPYRPPPDSHVGRMVNEKRVVHVDDAAADRGYVERSNPTITAAVELGGVRSFLGVPMIREGELVGAFTLCRQEVRPFTDKQIDLVRNFAAQAVIAVENTRLLNDLRQRTDELGRSVGELRALGEVSQAVNSTLELETVLSTIVAKAVQLSNTDAGAIYVYDDAARELQLRATYQMDRELIEALSHRHIGLDEANVAAALAQREPTQVADLRDEPPNDINELTIRAGFCARLTAPLFRGRDIVGMLVVRRRTPGAFPQNTVDLIKTFAAQSVLAIQNARLFHEIEDKSRELEVAGQHKSQFLANMSHELRTPLNAIIGYSEILHEEVTDLGQENLGRDLKKIEGAGRHLLGLINDILDLSKVEAGKMDLFLEDVEIVPLLEEVRALIVPLAEKNGNTLEFRAAADLGSMRTDRTKLKQSLLNILSNGSKFTHNGRLTLTAERFEADRPMVRFAVADTGIGMTEEQLGRLFQAFSQADASTTKKYGGTGLGLAISRRFCQLLGGDITVASRPGEGSTFTIALPMQSEMPAQIKPADAPRIAADAANGTTVLIVDDDAAARELLSATLKGAGYRLIHAASGEEALTLARTVRPDAITLDVMMPKPDGWEVLSALKADADLCDIPVVMVTVAPDRGIGLSLGAVDVLTKPVDRARLTALIHRLVRRDGPVLVVEDNADTRDMMRHTIEKLGLAVAEADNGRRALAWLGEHPVPAMILLDLMMPEMNGFEFLDALGARAEWREIPVVVVTAKPLSTAERDRLLRQARKVMEKGVATGVDIAAAVGEAVRRRSARQTAPANASEQLGLE